MRLEVVRMVADWLIDAAGNNLGINAFIPKVPVDVGDEPPDLIPAFDSADYPATKIAVFDESRHQIVLERKEPPKTPALYVTSQGVVSLTGEPWPNGQVRETVAPLKIVVRYLTANANLVNGLRDGEYTLRAVARSLRALSENNAIADAARERNGIQLIVGLNPMEFYPVVGAAGNARISGALLLNYKARDMTSDF